MNLAEASSRRPLRGSADRIAYRHPRADTISGGDPRRRFDDVAELYDRMRPGYPDEMFDDLAAVTGLTATSSVLEVGSGSGQATTSLARMVGRVTAVEPGRALNALVRRTAAANVEIVESSFESWDASGRRFDAIVSASAWHWIPQPVGWRRAHASLRAGGWMALLGHVVVSRSGEPEVYTETADLHERFAPGNPDWGRPPGEQDVRTTGHGWGDVADPGPLFGPTVVRWYPTVQTFDGAGFADLLRTLSPYRRLPEADRESLLAAVAGHIRDHMGDVAHRRYLSVLRVGRRADD